MNPFSQSAPSWSASLQKLFGKLCLTLKLVGQVPHIICLHAKESAFQQNNMNTILQSLYSASQCFTRNVVRRRHFPHSYATVLNFLQSGFRVFRRPRTAGRFSYVFADYFTRGNYDFLFLYEHRPRREANLNIEK